MKECGVSLQGFVARPCLPHMTSGTLEGQEDEGAEQTDQKVHQRQKKIKKTRKVQRILEEFRGIKNISSIKSVKKRILNPKVRKRQR